MEKGDRERAGGHIPGFRFCGLFVGSFPWHFMVTTSKKLQRERERERRDAGSFFFLFTLLNYTHSLLLFIFFFFFGIKMVYLGWFFFFRPRVGPCSLVSSLFFFLCVCVCVCWLFLVFILPRYGRERGLDGRSLLFFHRKKSLSSSSRGITKKKIFPQKNEKKENPAVVDISGRSAFIFFLLLLFSLLSRRFDAFVSENGIFLARGVFTNAPPFSRQPPPPSSFLARNSAAILFSVNRKNVHKTKSNEIER